MRFDPRDVALVVLGTDSAGEVQCAQWVHLTSDGTKAPETPDQPTKQTRGPVKGAAVRLSGRPGAPLQTAEGPETGLSVWVSTGCETWIALGSLGNLPTPPIGREVVACLDDDPRHKPNKPAGQQARKTIARWKRRGVNVVVVKPWPIRREDGSDFNDLLRQSGTGAVEARILGALDPRLCVWTAPVESAEPDESHMPVPSTRLLEDEPQPVPIARVRVRRLIEGAAKQALAEDGDAPAALAIGLGAGGGKSQIAFETAVASIRTMRAAGDERTIVFETPRTDLHDELAERIRDYERTTRPPGDPAVTVGVWRGSDAINPGGAPGDTMCRNRDPRRAAETRRLDPRTTVCPSCPFKPGCGKLAQYDTRADIWLVAHVMPFLPKSAALGKVAWRITDENAVGTALIGTGDPEAEEDDKPLVLTLDTLRRLDRVGADQGKTDALHEMRGRVIQALESGPDGRMRREPLIEAGITANMLEAKIKLEYGTLLEPEIHDGMTMDERLEALRAVDINTDLGRRAMLDRTMLTLLRSRNRAESGNTDVVTLHEAAGAVRAVSMKGRRTVAAGWKVPNTIIDATLQEELLRPLAPGVKIEKLAPLAAPHRHIVQCADRAFSGSMLDADAPDITAKERRRRTNNLARLHLTLAIEVRRRPVGRILIAAQKRTKERLIALGELGPRVVWIHYGAVTGSDEFKDVRHVIAIGRLLPPPVTMERQAEALTGATVDPLPEWYPRRDATYLMADGTRVATESDFHPNPVAEAFRWRTCEGELIQTIERARGVNRETDAERVDVLLLTDVPLPLPIDRLISAEELQPRIEDRMLAEGGVVYANAEAAAAAYPKIWNDGNAVRVQRHRERERHGCDWQPPEGLERASYRRDLNGAHNDEALVDRSVVLDPEAHIKAALGELARFELRAPLRPAKTDSSLGSVMQQSRSNLVETPIWACLPAGFEQGRSIAPEHSPDG
ncbi:MAG: toprim domain-containing protein [Rhodopila sp.]